jgi:hypothetical protein
MHAADVGTPDLEIGSGAGLPCANVVPDCRHLYELELVRHLPTIVAALCCGATTKVHR